MLACHGDVTSQPPTSSRFERYLGMWSEGVCSGPGIIVNSSGTYCEGTFVGGALSVCLTLLSTDFVFLIVEGQCFHDTLAAIP